MLKISSINNKKCVKHTLKKYKFKTRAPMQIAAMINAAYVVILVLGVNSESFVKISI
jgi:hypothetical protein